MRNEWEKSVCVRRKRDEKEEKRSKEGKKNVAPNKFQSALKKAIVS